MKSSLQPGVKGQLSTKVGPGNTITLGNDEQTIVFSTPSMINLMEHAAREALRSHLDSSEESVGVDVQIAHSSATPPTSEVTADATIKSVDKNVITFDVVARDPWGEIGRGTHRRAVIKTSKFASHLADTKTPEAKSTAPKEFPRLETIDCLSSNEILHLSLSRPRKRNAINALMTTDMERLLDWLEHPNNKTRVVIVQGSSDTFCAGDDVGDLPETPDAARELSLRRSDVYRRITLAGPTFIAAIDGLALGGGLVLAAACDFRIATHRAKLGLPEVTLGWPPNYGLAIVLSLIGRGRMLELAISGKPIDAKRAHEIGLVNRVVSVGQLPASVEQLAQQIGTLPSDARAAVKKLLVPGQTPCDQQATNAFLDCLSTEEARNSLAKFRQVVDRSAI